MPSMVVVVAGGCGGGWEEAGLVGQLGSRVRPRWFTSL
jgi:hypothetical protein